MNARNEKIIDEESPKARKDYSSPKMIRYGAVSELTQAGGTLANEDNSASGCRDRTRKSNPACLK